VPTHLATFLADGESFAEFLSEEENKINTSKHRTELLNYELL
jgi:hypothetical protein